MFVGWLVRRRLEAAKVFFFFPCLMSLNYNFILFGGKNIQLSLSGSCFSCGPTFVLRISYLCCNVRLVFNKGHLEFVNKISQFILQL